MWDDINPHELPTIEVGGRPQWHLTADAADALKQANDPPTVFRRDTALVRLRTEDEPTLEPMNQAAVRGHLDRVANWMRANRKGELVPVPPPNEVVADLLSRPTLPAPPVERIVTAPVFGADGTIHLEPGYHAASRTYFAAPSSLRVPEVSRTPTATEVSKARTLLVDELLGEFPFATDAERAHAVALLLLPFARDLIAGLTPLHLVEAASPGSGKGLLVTACLLPAMGGAVGVMAEGRDEDEWRKRLASKLMSGPTAVVIDNLRRRLDSSSLAAVLTTGSWEDRLLGQSRILRLPVRCVWVATGNNPALSSEIARRSVRIRLEAPMDRPWLRTGFRHADLRSWALDHRGELVWSALTLIQAWVSAGRPRGTGTLGMFEAWTQVMGGILDKAGITGFLSNLQQFYEVSDAERLALVAFIDLWWSKHGGDEVGVPDLWPMVDSGDVNIDLGSGTERSRRTQLGILLAQNRDRRFGKLQLQSAGTHQGGARWRLVNLREPSEPSALPLMSTNGNALARLGAEQVHEVHAQPEVHERLALGAYSLPDQSTGHCTRCTQRTGRRDDNGRWRCSRCQLAEEEAT